MEIRFKLDPQIDKLIIDTVLRRANGGSPSVAMRLLVGELLAREDALLSPRRHQDDAHTGESGEGDDLYAALANLAEEWD